SIVEFPVDKETVVTLSPVGLVGATGQATILRRADGTLIKVNLASLPNDITALTVYAIDPAGMVTSLGPLEIANGVGTFTTTVPLTKFMLFTAPEDNLTTYDAKTRIFFRSTVPTGLTVIPLTTAVGEQVAAVAVTSDYTVPMLGIPTLKAGDETK